MVLTLQEHLFRIAVREKVAITRLFWIGDSIILLGLVSGSLAIIGNDPGVMGISYSAGVWSGRAAVMMLAVVLVPGILGRFGIQIKVTRVLTFYRRQLGIMTFLLAFTHGMLVRNVARFALGWYPINLAPVFELFGSFALSLMFLLFITSNDASVVRMGPWWKRLHRLVYIIVLLVLFHTLLQRVSTWSILIGVVAILELVSLLWSGLLGWKRSIRTG